MNTSAAAMPPTRWSLLMDAREGDAGTKQRALEEFCRIYWQPLYFYARRRGSSPEDAEDVVQSFLAQLLAGDYLQTVATAPDRGRLRAYLLTGLTNYMAKQWSAQHRQKRGGQLGLLSLNVAEAEGIYIAEPADAASPDLMFERRWAMSLFQHCLGRLRHEYESVGKGQLFEVLKNTLALSGAEAPISDIATATGMSEGAVRVATHRLRQHLRAILEEEVKQTVAKPEDVQDEMRYLMRLLVEG